MTEKTKIKISIEGVDVTRELEKNLLSLTYVDNDTDQADDLQIEISDEEGKWLHSYLTPKKEALAATKEKQKQREYKVGDEVTVSGRPHYTSYGGKSGREVKNHTGKITHLNKRKGATHPIHIDYLGWFKEEQISGAETKRIEENANKTSKGLEVTAVIIQENFGGTTKSKVLNCGVFCVDDIGISGPPTKIKFKALSIPYNANIKEQKKTKAWEEINLESIGKEIAANSGLKYIYDSKTQVKYKRREQKEESDLKFLLRLCKDAGISIKVTSKTLVLYDAANYETKKAIGTIEYGSSDILSYGFNTNKNETAYTGAEVKSKDPKTGKYIKFTYNIPNAKGEKKILEIKEKVNSKEEAEALAKKRLRSVNKGEFNASITLVGNVDYIASQTIEIKGFGLYDGKYIINSASHKLTGGYTVALKLNKVLEGY